MVKKAYHGPPTSLQYIGVGSGPWMFDHAKNTGAFVSKQKGQWNAMHWCETGTRSTMDFHKGNTIGSGSHEDVCL